MFHSVLDTVAMWQSDTGNMLGLGDPQIVNHIMLGLYETGLNCCILYTHRGSWKVLAYCSLQVAPPELRQYLTFKVSHKKSSKLRYAEKMS